MPSPWWRSDTVPWSADGWCLHLRGDELAEIRRGDRLVLRSIRAVVRDRGWGTVPVHVDRVVHQEHALVVELRHEGLGARVRSTLRVHASASRLHVNWEAVAETGFDTCRTGLVVLHPPSDAGSHVTVQHTDGTTERTTLPVEISPHQPIQDIRELRIDDRLALRFEGDVFEMEDQRNWTDASFKTYSRPLDLPYPYRIEAGEQVRQSITLAAASSPATSALPSLREETIVLSPGGDFPAIGVEASTAPDPVPPSGIGGFRVIELDLTTPTWSAALARAASDGVLLDVRLVTGDDPTALFAAAQALLPLDVVRLTAFDAAEHVSTAAAVSALRDAAAAAGLHAPFLAGARSHFTELNREQARIPRDVAGMLVNTTPLFHSHDTEQLVEAVAMQRLVAAQSVLIASGLPVHIGPVSLRPRFNNVSTTPESRPTRPDLSQGYGAEFTGAVDARQRSPELAAWVIASAAALAVPGVASLAWFETWGPRGLVDAHGPSPAAGAVRALTEMSGGGSLLSGDSPDGLVWALGARTPHGDVVLAANLDRSPRLLPVALPGGHVEEVSLPAGEWRRVTITE